jgi:hypothetical protein
LTKDWPQPPYVRAVYLGLAPVCVHGVLNLFFGVEAEGPAVILFAGMMSAAFVGGFLATKKFNIVEASLAAAWPSWLAGWRHWHWSLDMPAPGGAAQSLVETFGWREPPMPAALGAVLVSCGALGWLFMRGNRRYKRKTGHSLFEEQ